MTTPMDTWLSRNSALNCFPSQLAAIAYAAAWTDGDDALIQWELERIFTQVYPLPQLNWVASNSTARALGALADGPASVSEDWSELDFVCTTAMGRDVPLSWLAPGGHIGVSQWNELSVDLIVAVSRFGARGKIEFARAEEAFLRRTDAADRQPLVNLVRAASFGRVVAANPSLQGAIDHPALSLGAGARCYDRAMTLAGLGWGVVYGGSIRTLHGLRACTSTNQLKQYVLALKCPALDNLVTFLSCSELEA